MSENCERGPGGNEVCQRRGNMRGGVRSSTSTSTSTTSTSMWSKEGGNLGRAGVDETKNETTSTSTSNLRGSANIAQQPQVEEPVVEIKTPPTQTPNFRSSVIAPTATSTPTATPAAEAVPAVPAVPENKLNLRGSAENAKTVDASTVDQKHGHHHHVHDHSGHHHHDHGHGHEHGHGHDQGHGHHHHHHAHDFAGHNEHEHNDAAHKAKAQFNKTNFRRPSASGDADSSEPSQEDETDTRTTTNLRGRRAPNDKAGAGKAAGVEKHHFRRALEQSGGRFYRTLQLGGCLMIVIPLIYIIRKKLWAFFFQQADNSRKKRDSSRVPLPDVEECVRQLNFDDELPDLPPLPPSRSTLPSPASIMPSPASSMCSGSLMPSPASSIAPSPACSPPGDHMARVYSSSSVKRRTRQMPAQSYTFVSTAGPCMYTHSSTSYTPFEEEPVAIFEKPMLKPTSKDSVGSTMSASSSCFGFSSGEETV